MPACGCYHYFEIASPELGKCEVTLAPSGTIDLQRVLERLGLAHSIRTDNNLLDSTIVLTGVQDHAELTRILEHLKSVIFVRLIPWLDECYALAPYSLFSDGDRQHSPLGEKLHRAKYSGDSSALNELQDKAARFIEGHPIFRSVDAVAVPPKSDHNTVNVPESVAKHVASRLGCALQGVTKFRRTRPQKELLGHAVEEDVVSAVSMSFSIPRFSSERSVLVIDDTLGSGGTMMEVGRALRDAGAATVYGLGICKDATYATSGIDFAQERWS